MSGKGIPNQLALLECKDQRLTTKRTQREHEGIPEQHSAFSAVVLHDLCGKAFLANFGIPL
ncbi:MAG: hypothetical protein DMG82_09385 [Acidobacteria bacterium]|nr:MAG: hypothetical protein DMG82_09385 [Acidobacteriota bacterium]